MIAFDRETIRTILDFRFTFKGEKTVRVYADGHTYYERTEYQALRKRSIDREVQLFSYTVLRFTSKEISSYVEGVIQKIKQALYN